MYFLHSILLFIPVLWKERRRREGRRENGEMSERMSFDGAWRGGKEREKMLRKREGKEREEGDGKQQ